MRALAPLGLFLALAVGAALGCGAPGSGADAATGDGATTACADADGDGIADADDGDGDVDGDRLRNATDLDSDGDGIDDATEAGRADCSAAPVDSDGDGLADFVDLDSDGNGILDASEPDGDLAGNRIADRVDPDDDGDGLPDVDELDAGGALVDTDGDGVPDHRDTDSDGDEIPDGVESGWDPDGDGLPNSRDLDSDGNGIPDSVEGWPASGDTDDDDDGLSDAEEREVGTSSSSGDTDGDGHLDVAEVAYDRVHGTHCATDATCGIPADDYYVVLPYRGPDELRTLEFGTDIHVADVFFLIDTTGSMGAVIDGVRASIASMIPRLAESIPDVQLGLGRFDDFGAAGCGEYACGAYGIDEVLEVLQSMTDDPSLAVDAASRLDLHAGGDIPECQVEALYQTMTGEGIGIYLAPAPACPDGRWGYPCFRESALPIIVMVTDADMHNGPPGTFATSYVGITPPPHTWDGAIDVLNAHGAKMVGIDASRSGRPAHDLTATMIATGSVDGSGAPFYVGLPDPAAVVDRATDAVVRLAHELPLDLTTIVYDDPAFNGGVDARAFVQSRRPVSWEAPAGVAHDAAVGRIDDTTFYGVVPGTRVRFEVTFQNDVVPEATTTQLFRARIAVRTGATDLDEREVYIIVPAVDLR